jgi:hypothetical protein
MTRHTWKENRVINGVPYLFSWDAERNLWRVTAGESPTDRFWRAYSVYCTPGGTPLRCTCADCHHRKNWCKHLKEAERLQRELNPAASEALRETAIRCGMDPNDPSLDILTVKEV